MSTVNITFRKLTPREAEFVIEGVNHAFANALRRTLVADIPKLAIDEVTIYDNTSALFDEMVAHRLGLMPVPTDPELFNFRDQCTCGGEGCPSCTVLFTLSKEGPATGGPARSESAQAASSRTRPAASARPARREGNLITSDSLKNAGSENSESSLAHAPSRYQELSLMQRSASLPDTVIRRVGGTKAKARCLHLRHIARPAPM